MRLLPGMVMLMLVLVISGSARATTDVMPFKDEAQEQQFRQLTEQLRCPKCQNNSIADSNAMIATDMRRRVYDLMQEGKSRQEIIDYMVARYGNFVTYDPPLTPLTVLLWVLPLAAIVAGGWIICLLYTSPSPRDCRKKKRKKKKKKRKKGGERGRGGKGRRKGGRGERGEGRGRR
ncbi:cytochrome c-type biogenesis protein, partial [Salmonella enterica]|uniref:cytochrome c-type biogenesis protein n=1 Tax=Salmonella enterica TaxID=28901 RepID=UPI001E2945B9